MTSSVEHGGFYGAATARQIAMGQASGDNDVLAEVNSLKVLIDGAASTGNLEVLVSTTPMAISQAYFDSWNDPYNNDTAADRLNRERMNQVINYFSRLGYAIKRKRVGVTNFFEWQILW